MNTSSKIRLVVLAILITTLMFLTHLCYADDHVVVVDYRTRVENKVWLDTQIQYAGALAKLILEDIDYDGRITCIDYSVAFKRAWDNMRGDASCSLLVWNTRYDFNHMFVTVRDIDSNTWYNVEPQAAINRPGSTRYMIADYWPSTEYNALYNIYDKDSWLWFKSLRNDW